MTIGTITNPSLTRKLSLFLFDILYFYCKRGSSPFLSGIVHFQVDFPSFYIVLLFKRHEVTGASYLDFSVRAAHKSCLNVVLFSHGNSAAA